MAKRKTELDIDTLEDEPVVPEPQEKPVEEIVEVSAPSEMVSKKKKIIIIIAVLATLLIISVIIAVILMQPVKKEKKVVINKDGVEEIVEEEEEIEEEIIIPTLELAPFILPVGKKGGEMRFIRMSITLLLNNMSVADEINKNNFLIRDNIITLIKRKKYSEFNSVKITEKIANDIRRTINMSLQTGMVKKIYFTNLMIL